MKKNKLILIALLTSLLTACNFFDKDNTPVPSPLCAYTPETNIHPIWRTNTGTKVAGEQLKPIPALADRAIFTTGKNGSVIATDKATGNRLWKTKVCSTDLSGAGTNSNLVFVGSLNGDVFALQQSNGGMVWRTKVSSEVLAPPAANNNMVLVKTLDGKLSALSAQDGHELWHYDQVEPNFLLRGSSSPQVTNNNVIVGFANGNLAKLSLRDGMVEWREPLTIPQGNFAIQRLIDIDADPVINNNRIYAATYQGRLVALELSSGKTIWSHDISVFAGLAADKQHVYVSDAKSHIWSFNGNSGSVNWRQSELEARNTTGPASIGNYIVVGDAEGYLHCLSKADGHIVGRLFVSKSGIVATPVVQNNILYVLSKDGSLASYTLG